ncbi:hypothetical protein [Chryseobacterium sp.]|uniref:hypothetical protein n=1 Tax=Chryseobacterium sp. TaxID=1871047 RepID=UPI00289870AD|nr:hypothetical protein [Chryseobacterium sp.]
MKEIILHNQSILDVALQHTGTVESCFEIATRNGFSVSDQLEAGISIEIPENVLKNTDVLNMYSAKKIEPATSHSDIGDSEIPTLKGIGYMQIGNNFKTS